MYIFVENEKKSSIYVFLKMGNRLLYVLAIQNDHCGQFKSKLYVNLTRTKHIYALGSEDISGSLNKKSDDFIFISCECGH